MILKKNCTFDCTYDAGKLEILLHGEIDHHSAVAIRARLDEKIYELRPSLMVMDLSEIDFMDSSGLGLIIRRYALMKKMGGDFCVSNPNDRIMKIFELAGLGRIIRIESGKEED